MHSDTTDGTLGLPRLNEPAPTFAAATTDGPRALSDYKGQWLVLFSHPADFTPVCTTEFMAFAQASERFAAANCALLGLSIDSNFAHVAWIRSIEENFGVKIPFPIIEDLSMTVAKAYGMIQPGASDTHGVATPEAWRAGEKVIVPPPKTTAEAEARKDAGYDYVDWYFCKKDLAA